MVDDLFLVAITPAEPVPDEAQRLLELAEAGFSHLHLRHPELDADAMRRILDTLDPRLLPMVRIHAHPELIAEYPLGGLHLGQRCPAVPPGVHPKGVSRSLHSVAELAEVQPGKYDYVTYSPVYPSISKPGYRPEQPGMAAPPCAVPVVALGGVTPHHLKELKTLGYAGAAMSGALWGPEAVSLDNMKTDLNQL